MARCTLELGGKSAAVILDDFDIDMAANTIAGPAVWLSGQVCSSLTRIIVPRRRHDQFVDALSAVFGKFKVGDRSIRLFEWGRLRCGGSGTASKELSHAGKRQVRPWPPVVDVPLTWIAGFFWSRRYSAMLTIIPCSLRKKFSGRFYP